MFNLRTWSSPRWKNRLCVLAIVILMILAGASVLLTTVYKVPWLMLILEPLFAAMLIPLWINIRPGPIFTWIIDNILKKLPGGEFLVSVTEFETHKAEYKAEVETMMFTLDFYKLCLNGVNLRALILASPPAAKTEDQRLDHCTQVLEKIFHPAHPHITAPLLKLLYYERKDESKTPWAHYKKSHGLAGLVKVLIESDQLHPSTKELPYQHQLERIVRPIEELAVNTVCDVLKSLQAIWRVSERYGQFLDSENDLPVGGLSFGDVLDRLEEVVGLPTKPDEAQELRKSLMKILLLIGDKSIMAKHTGIEDGEKKIHSQIALTVFLTKVLVKENVKEHIEENQRVAMLSEICGELFSLEDAHHVILAYLDLRGDVPVSGREYVSINHLISHWRAQYGRWESGRREMLNQEIDEIREKLSEGHFPVRLLPVITPNRLDELKKDKEYRELLDLAKRRKAILNILRRIFRDLTLTTVKRFMETPGSDAYLLTFSSLRGSLAEIVDSLVAPGLRKDIEALGIELVVAGRTKYNFKHYTSSARIGVLPPLWSFEDFATALQHDLSVIIGARQTLFPDSGPEIQDIELLIHRFNLSEKDYFEFKHEQGRQHAVLNIRDLLSETLPPDQQLALLRYDGEVNIIDALLAGPIVELTADEVRFTEEERTGLELRDDALKNDLIKERKAASIQEFAQRLTAQQERQELTAQQERQEAEVTLTGLLGKRVPVLQDQRCEEVAKSYVGTLEAVASIRS